jgi:hypothetical protein
LRKLKQEVIEKINSGSDESIQTFCDCDLPTVSLQNLDNRILEFLSFLFFSYEQIIEQIVDESQKNRFKKGLAQTFFCINHVVNFAFFGPNGTTFDWIDCERMFSTPEGLEKLIKEALAKCENS